MSNLDDYLRQVEEDEQKDRVAEQPFASVRDYALSRGIVPQRVYYRIRSGQLQITTCPCGRRVVDVAAADQVMFPNEETQWS